MSKKTNVLLASAVAASVLMMGAQGASAAGKVTAADKSAGVIEQRLKMMEDQMNAMRSELSRVRAESASNAKVADLEAKVAKTESVAAASAKKSKSNMVFFRGGYTQVKQARGGNGPLGTSGAPELLVSNGDNNGWYSGAGLDFSLSDNLFGLTDQAELLGEIMFEYKNFGSSHNTLTGVAEILGTSSTGPQTKNEITMFTLTASPKIKFMPGSDFRPWIIPAGLAMHVISPPSNGVTVLNPGLMTGVGADYKIWNNIYAGADFRYHFTGDSLGYKSTRTGARGTNTDGFTSGAYLGIGF